MSWLQDAMNAAQERRSGLQMRKAIKFDKKNPHKFEPHLGGLEVVMFKDDPGKYYDVNGNPISTQMAKLVGFETDKLAKQRLKRERLAAVTKQIEEQLELTADNDEPVILAEKGSYKIIALAAGRAKVVDQNFADVTPLPVTEAEARMILKSLTADEEEPTIEEPIEEKE